jgi:hypothetical protein
MDPLFSTERIRKLCYQKRRRQFIISLYRSRFQFVHVSLRPLSVVLISEVIFHRAQKFIIVGRVRNLNTSRRETDWKSSTRLLTKGLLLYVLACLNHLTKCCEHHTALCHSVSLARNMNMASSVQCAKLYRCTSVVYPPAV